MSPEELRALPIGTRVRLIQPLGSLRSEAEIQEFPDEPAGSVRLAWRYEAKSRLHSLELADRLQRID